MTKTQETDIKTKSVSVEAEFDVDLYAHHLDDTDMSDEEKQVFLETLFQILVQFIDVGFEIPRPSKGISCIEKSVEKLASNSADALYSNHSNTLSPGNGKGRACCARRNYLN